MEVDCERDAGFWLPACPVQAAIETTGSDDGVMFQAHDFSMRGMSGFIDASNTGIAHLSCFYGTDTVPAIEVVEKHYAPEPGMLIGSSIPLQVSMSSRNVARRKRKKVVP